jgi:hypothetical protein
MCVSLFLARSLGMVHEADSRSTSLHRISLTSVRRCPVSSSSLNIDRVGSDSSSITDHPPHVLQLNRAKNPFARLLCLDRPLYLVRGVDLDDFLADGKLNFLETSARMRLAWIGAGRAAIPLISAIASLRTMSLAFPGPKVAPTHD